MHLRRVMVVHTTGLRLCDMPKPCESLKRLIFGSMVVREFALTFKRTVFVFASLIAGRYVSSTSRICTNFRRLVCLQGSLSHVLLLNWHDLCMLSRYEAKIVLRDWFYGHFTFFRYISDQNDIQRVR